MASCSYCGGRKKVECEWCAGSSDPFCSACGGTNFHACPACCAKAVVNAKSFVYLAK